MILGDKIFHSNWYQPLRNIIYNEELVSFCNKLENLQFKQNDNGKRVHIGNKKILVDLNNLIFYDKEEFDEEEWRNKITDMNKSKEIIYYVSVSFLINCIKDILEIIDMGQLKNEEEQEEENQEITEGEENNEKENNEEEIQEITSIFEDRIGDKENENILEKEDKFGLNYVFLSTFYLTIAPILVYIFALLILNFYDISYKTNYSNYFQSIVENSFKMIENNFKEFITTIMSKINK